MSQSERKAVVELDKKLKVLVGYDSERIYTRAEWGSILSFEPFRQDFERSFGLARIFSDLPYHLLPDAQLNTIGIAVETASTHFAQIDSFDSATANNPQNLVKTLGNTVKTHADVITVEMAQWISYLAYQKGDVSQNIKARRSHIQRRRHNFSGQRAYRNRRGANEKNYPASPRFCWRQGCNYIYRAI
jgi:hypothetical protein